MPFWSMFQISKALFGFRPGGSTQDAVMSVTREWHTNMEEDNSSAVVYFDLSKAFDSLPHQLILSSLAKAGACGSLFSWVQSYLSDRTRRVVLNGTSSSSTLVTSGVPQGSILGPLLFIISIDSLASLNLSPHASLTMYADDICYHKSIAIAEDKDMVHSERHQHNCR